MAAVSTPRWKSVGKSAITFAYIVLSNRSTDGKRTIDYVCNCACMLGLTVDYEPLMTFGLASSHLYPLTWGHLFWNHIFANHAFVTMAAASITCNCRLTVGMLRASKSLSQGSNFFLIHVLCNSKYYIKWPYHHQLSFIKGHWQRILESRVIFLNKIKVQGIFLKIFPSKIKLIAKIEVDYFFCWYLAKTGAMNVVMFH